MKKFVILLLLSVIISSNVGLSEPVEKDNLRALIEEYEGIKLKAYRCPKGIPTIGIGSTRYDDGRKVKLGDEISLDYAEVLYEREVDKIRKEVDQLVTPDLNKNQEDALVSFAYNVGITAFKSSTLLEKVNKDPRSNSIKREFMKWTTSDGRRLKGLVKRRKAEVDLYFLKMPNYASSSNS
jgi:lysozyme